MLIAGESSGDMLAAELVEALRQELLEGEPAATTDYQPLSTSLEPRFFGAGGPQMAKAGVELAFDMTEHSVTGLSDAVMNYPKFRRLFHQLLTLAINRGPDAIICVDFSGFNLRFARAIKQYVRSRSGWFHDWNPRIIQYVSPQVWASREGRAYQMARDCHLLLSTFPFEKRWYARKVPRLHVEFVGNAVLDRFPNARGAAPGAESAAVPTVLLLPGSRSGELIRHLPVMRRAVAIMRAANPGIVARMVLPDETLVRKAKDTGLTVNLKVQAGGLGEALASADLAIASTGTVTLECALFGVPTVAMYKTSWSSFQVAKRIAKVKYLAMPNILANEQLFPEFIQHQATAENIARAGLELLRDGDRAKVKTRLAEVVATLGGPGASRRAARAILRLLKPQEAGARRLVAAVASD